jgi:hypothetical protein
VKAKQYGGQDGTKLYSYEILSYIFDLLKMGKDSKKKKKHRSRSPSPRNRERRRSSSPEYESRREPKEKSRMDKRLVQMDK